MPLTNLYESVKNGVVQVLALDNQNVIASGSGSVIHDGKTVLSCEHCVVPNAQMAIAHPTTPGMAIPGHVVFCDPAMDVALIEFASAVGTPVRMANSSSCAVGNGAFVVGFPMDAKEQTLISAHIATKTGDKLRIDASVNHGNSGGPLFNLQGEQIGIVNAKHGSLSQFLTQIKNMSGPVIRVGQFDAVKTIQVLIEEMQRNLNLGIGYAIPTEAIKHLHTILGACIP